MGRAAAGCDITVNIRLAVTANWLLHWMRVPSDAVLTALLLLSRLQLWQPT